MAILGGSPLGLVGSKSRPENTGFSSLPFDGNTIGVARYNQSNDGWAAYQTTSAKGKGDRADDASKDETVTTFDANNPLGNVVNRASISIFSGTSKRPTRFTPFPYMNPEGTKEDDPDIQKDGLTISKFHGDDIYDTSLLNIMQKTKGLLSELKASHFAYLKNVGVFPNNRLMIARRFQNPGEGAPNIMRKGAPPIAVMIGYVPQDTDFFSLSFGEEWEAAQADFTAILNDLGSDFSKASGLGDKLGGGLGLLPLPGFTETIQRLVFSKLGIMNENSASYIPAGEPNLIKEAKKRKTIGYSEAGSGLKCSFQVKMTCEWEQKFISGLDPTIVYLDIIQSVLRFSTSNSVSYGLSGGFADKIRTYVNDPMRLIYDFISAIKQGIATLINGINALLKKAKAAIDKQFGPKPEASDQSAADAEAKSLAESEKKTLDAKVKEITDNLTAGVGFLLKRIVQKYKVRIEGVLNALTGQNSGPWHVTIGNPLRPVFSSGDLIISDVVTLSFGSTLAFNDLPSTIKAEFTLVPARNLGLQEIFARFNSGHIRSVLPYPSGPERQTFAKALGILDKGQISKSGTEEEAKKYSEEQKKDIEAAEAAFYGQGTQQGPPDPILGPRFEGKYRDEPKPQIATSNGKTNNNTNSNISNTGNPPEEEKIKKDFVNQNSTTDQTTEADKKDQHSTEGDKQIDKNANNQQPITTGDIKLTQGQEVVLTGNSGGGAFGGGGFGGGGFGG